MQNDDVSGLSKPRVDDVIILTISRYSFTNYLIKSFCMYDKIKRKREAIVERWMQVATAYESRMYRDKYTEHRTSKETLLIIVNL